MRNGEDTREGKGPDGYRGSPGNGGGVSTRLIP